MLTGTTMDFHRKRICVPGLFIIVHHTELPVYLSNHRIHYLFHPMNSAFRARPGRRLTWVSTLRGEKNYFSSFHSSPLTVSWHKLLHKLFPPAGIRLFKRTTAYDFNKVTASWPLGTLSFATFSFTLNPISGSKGKNSWPDRKEISRTLDLSLFCWYW